MKNRLIEEQLASIDRDLAHAEAYVEQNVNVRGKSWLHLDDWKGKSGHPLWMKNHMIPTLAKARVRTEKTMERIDLKDKKKELAIRRRRWRRA